MNPDLRVLHVLEAVRGGTSRYLADVVRHTPGVRHHVCLPPPDRPGGPVGGAPYDRASVHRMKDAGAVVHHVDMRRQPFHPVNGVALGRLGALIHRIDPAVVHGHSSVGGALARLAGRATGRPVVYTANGVAPGTFYGLVERVLGMLTDRWVAVSESEAALALGHGMADAYRLATIPNGIERCGPAGGPDLRSMLDMPPGSLLVGSVARLVPQKAPVTFVRTAGVVARLVPEAHFLLVGMGPLQKEVDVEVARAGLGGRWHHLQHLESASSAIGQLDVFVLASAFEGGPYTPLEAVRAGVPVVLTDVVGNRDVIEHGLSGFLCPRDDPEALGRAVAALLGDAALRERVATAAAGRLAERFDVDKMGAALAGVYLDLVRSRPPA